MRADPRQTPGAEPIVPPSVPTEELPGKPPARSAPVAQSAETHSEVPINPTATEAISLLPDDAANRFRSRWELIQSGFVDDPRRSVEQAGALVEEALDQLSAVFDEKRAHLQRDGNVPTEDLRQTLRHYRLLLNRLF
jgi:hypothetical protein